MTAKRQRGRPRKGSPLLHVLDQPEIIELAPHNPATAPFFFELREDEIDPAALARSLSGGLREFTGKLPGLRKAEARALQRWLDAAATAMERGNAAFVAWYMAHAIRAARAATWHEELEVPGVGRRTIDQLAAIGAEKLRADKRKGRRTEVLDG